MTTHATATFGVKSWDEKTWDGKPHKEVSGAKLTHAHVVVAYEGDIVGTGTREYLMYYRADGTAAITGLEQIVGSLGGRSGSFVLQNTGSFDGENVRGTVTVVPGSGTGDLRGLRGEGVVNLVGHAERYPMTLDYHFES
jgi:hypothetical protein